MRVVREEGAEMRLMQSVASAYLCMPAPRPNRLTQFSTRSHHDQTDLVQIYSAAAATSPWRTLACVHAWLVHRHARVSECGRVSNRVWFRGNKGFYVAVNSDKKDEPGRTTSCKSAAKTVHLFRGTLHTTTPTCANAAASNFHSTCSNRIPP